MAVQAFDRGAMVAPVVDAEWRDVPASEKHYRLWSVDDTPDLLVKDYVARLAWRVPATEEAYFLGITEPSFNVRNRAVGEPV